MSMLPYPQPTPPFNAHQPFVLLAGPDVLEGNGALNEEAAHYLKGVCNALNRYAPVQFYFKASYDKANRTSVDAYRGPGWQKGLPILQRIKESVGVPIMTDVHSVEEIAPVAEVADMLQIPAFLSRQTDLLLAAGNTNLPINIKKGQFLSPKDVRHAAKKVAHPRAGDLKNIYITERGTTFGYNNLVVDMRSIPIIQEQGLPVIFDATHSVQLPGGQGTSSGGERQYATTLARAAVAAGCNGLFLETHPDPDNAPCDGANMIPLEWVEPLLMSCLEIREAILKNRVPVKA